MNERQKQKKEARQMIKLAQKNLNKNLLIVSVLPVIADYIEDLNMEQSNAYQNVYNAIRELDEKITAKGQEQSEQEYRSAMDAQIAIQRGFRQFFIEMCKSDYDEG